MRAATRRRLVGGIHTLRRCRGCFGGSNVSLTRTLSTVASAAVLAGATLVAMPAMAVAAPIAPAASSAESCIPAGGGIGTGTPNAVDGQVNVYVGGDFNLVSGAELEGLLVVEGDATFGGAGLYNTGVVGVGSLLTPPPMSDMILVGGDMSVAEERRLDVGHIIGGGVRVGGVINAGPQAIETNGAARVEGVGKASALGDRAAVSGAIRSQSASYAAMPTTGTAAVEYGTLTLTGDGTANRQVFTLDGATAAKAGSLQYKNIDPESIVVINVVGDTARFAMSSMLHENGTVMDPMNVDKGAFGALTQRLLWNFPTASDVVIGGSAQFPGSVLVANPDSTTSVKVPGTNGRMWVAGNLTHDLGTGSEIHAFPFLDGDVFGCGPTEPEAPLAQLAQPSVEHAVCATDGKPSVPTVTLPTSDELSYVLTGRVAAGETVTVTATSLSATKIAPLAGWTLAADSLSATLTITLADRTCEEPVTPDTTVTPAAPTVTQAVCTEDSAASLPTLEVAVTEGIDYAVSGDLLAGSTAVVTATAKPGFALAPTTGWEATATGAQFLVVFDAVSCTTNPEQPGPKPGPEPTPKPGPEPSPTPGPTPKPGPTPTPAPVPAPHDAPAATTGLAVSGAGSLTAIGIGAAALLVLGMTVLVATRARRSQGAAE